MNTDLEQQTDLMIKALTQLHNDLGVLDFTLIGAATVIIVLLLIIALKRVAPRQQRQQPEPTADEIEEQFIAHVEAMVKKHPDWLKTSATSHMAVAREFWNHGRSVRK